MNEDSADYLRDVAAHIIAMSDETSTVLEDLKADGIEGSIRRAAFAAVITDTFPKEAIPLVDAMRIAGVTASQAAIVFNITSFKMERRNDKH